MPGLRPTSDRIRETLFNWLQADIIGARCLDLFAGSGALGFEALSRNADTVVFVDTAQSVFDQIKNNLNTLKNQRGELFKGDAMSYLDKYCQPPFDIIFLDPPFNQNLLQQSIGALKKSACLKNGTLIYVECEKKLDIDVPEGWKNLKEKKAGQVKYMLFECS